MTSRKIKRSQETRKDSGVFFSPMPMTTFPDSRSRVASLLKSPSLDTMQKPCTESAYSVSIASMMRPMSEAFFPGVLLGCITGVSEYPAEQPSHERRRSCDQSPYMRRMVIFPYLESSLKMTGMYLELMLSASINSAMLISSIYCPQ